MGSNSEFGGRRPVPLSETSFFGVSSSGGGIKTSSEMFSLVAISDVLNPVLAFTSNMYISGHLSSTKETF